VKTIEGITKATEISNAKIQFISLVDSAANQRKFLLTKAKNNKANFTSFGKIIKADKQNHYVTGIVYEPKKEDTHGDFMTEEEITKAAYYFAKNSNKIDLQHNFEPLDCASVVESWIAKADFHINDETIQKGTWLMTVEIANDTIWNKIEKGEITGFSMGGFGEFSKEDKNLEQEQETNEKKGLFKQLAEAFGFSVVEKSGKKMSSKNKETLKSIYENMGTFLKEFDDSNEQYEEEKTMTREEIEQMVAEAVKKAMQNNQQKPKEPAEEEITQQKIEKMVQKALEKATEQQQPQQQNIRMEQVEEMITKAVTKAVEPILKSTGIPSNLNDDGSLQKSAEKQHYMHGIL